MQPGRGFGETAGHARAAGQDFERTTRDIRLRQLAHPDARDLRGRDAQGHLVLAEIDDEKLKLEARNLLFLDGDDLTYPVRRVNHKFVEFEAVSIRAVFHRFLIAALFFFFRHLRCHGGRRPKGLLRHMRSRRGDRCARFHCRLCGRYARSRHLSRFGLQGLLLYRFRVN